MRSDKLTKHETSRLAICKQTVIEGLQGFCDVGMALHEIRELKLYREEFETFELFCRSTFGMSGTHAYRMIQAAEIKTSPIGEVIQNEAQARAISQVPKQDRPKVLKLAERSGDLTAQAISVAAETVEASKPAEKLAEKKAEKEIRKDAIGRIIPDDVVPDWDRAASVASKLRSCASEIKVTVERGLADKDIIFAEITNPTIAEASGLHYTLSQIAPHSVCPSCQGKLRKNCQLCKRRGWISKYLYNSPAVSSETKAILEKVAKK